MLRKTPPHSIAPSTTACGNTCHLTPPTPHPPHTYIRQGEEADEQRERPAWLLAQQGTEEESEAGSTLGPDSVPASVPGSAPGTAPSTAKAAGGAAALLDLLGEG